MTAQAITVLPVPGGATSTPRSCPVKTWTAACCGPVNTADQVNGCVVPAARSSVRSSLLPASPAGAVTGVSMPGPDQPAVDGLVEELQESRDVPGGSTHPLLLVELPVVHR